MTHHADGELPFAQNGPLRARPRIASVIPSLSCTSGVKAMDEKRVRLKKPKRRPGRQWIEELPLDPDVLRVKTLAQGRRAA
jgi:hypothetical protein